IFEQAGVDELGVLRTGDPDIRPGQHVVDRLGEEETADEGDAEGDERLDQPRAQLDEVIQQRRLAGFDLLFLVFEAHADFPPASGGPAPGPAPTGASDDDGAVSAGGAVTGSAAAVAGSAAGSVAAGPLAESTGGLSAIALSICCCALSNSLRTSATGSKWV